MPARQPERSAYRPAISHAAAIEELRRMAGSQFDPELVEVFAEQFPEGLAWAPDAHAYAPADGVRAPITGQAVVPCAVAQRAS